MSETCPTCGSAVEVRGDGTTKWYVPVGAPEPLDETCRACGKPVTDREWSANWGICADCFDAMEQQPRKEWEA